jgi:hypothetical protein
MVLGWPIKGVKMKSRSFLAAICFFFLTTTLSFGYKATLLPRISVKTEYTDNILLTNIKDLQENDYITTVTPGFTGELDGKKGNAKVSYDASYAYYNRFDEFNGWRHKATLSGVYGISKNTNFNIEDNFLYTEDPNRYAGIAIQRTESPTIPIDTTPRKTRTVYMTNYASVGIHHQFGKHDALQLGYSHSLYNNDDPAYEDKQSQTATAEVTHWLGLKWGFHVSGQYTRGEYEFSNNLDDYKGSISLLKRFGKHFIGYIRYTHDVVTYDGESGNDTTYIPTIGFKYDIEKDISLTADAGYYYTSSDFRENTSNVGGALRLIKRFEHGRLNLALLGGYVYDLYGAQSFGYGEYYEGSTVYSQQLSKHVYGHIFGFYRDTTYKDLGDREDKIPSVGVGFGWQALQWMVVSIDYQYTSVNSTIDTAEYNENRISATITLTPKVPFHTSRY